jgi:hypothetical protein
MVLTVSFALSSVIGLCCHRRLRGVSGPTRADIAFRELDASVEASGPHDFAVRCGAVRLSAHQRPSPPALNVRDDRETPLSEAGRHEICD